MRFNFTEINIESALTAFSDECSSAYKCGRVYAIEINGETVKVGVSGNPSARFKAHYYALRSYGFDITRVAFSQKIAQAGLLEQEIHSVFNSYLCKNTKEVFSITMSDFLRVTSSIEITRTMIGNDVLFPEVVFTRRELEEWASANGFRREYKVLRFPKNNIKKCNA